MEPQSIIMIVFIIVLLYIVINMIMSDSSKLTTLTSATTMQKIEALNLSSSDSGASATNFSYSIWYYVDDWNYRYGEPKVLFGRATPSADVTSSSPLIQPCPSVVFTPIQNNLIVSVTCFTTKNRSSPGTVSECTVLNFPIQKWVNLLISVYGKALDVYLDGKLVKTCILPGVPMVNSKLPAFVTPMGGFSGWTSKFQYWTEAKNPQQAWNIYQNGYGSSFLSGLFNQYSVKVALMQGSTETSSVQI